MGEPVLRLVAPAGEDGAPSPWRPPAPPAGPRPGATSAATPDPVVAPAAADVAVPAGATTPASGPEPAGTPAAAETAGPAPAGAPEIELYGRPLTPAGRARRAAAHWARQARKDAARPGGFWHDVWHGRGESLADIHAYAASRAWVPEGHAGGLVPAAGVLYAHTIAKGGAALGHSIAWVTARMLRLTLFLVTCGVLAVLIICLG